MVSASGCQPRTAARYWRAAAARAVINSRFPTNDTKFGRNCRLADDALIRRTLRYGKLRESDHFRFHCLSTPDNGSRWCLRIPKKLGSAVARNRLRRLMREFLRTHKSFWPAESAVVLTARLSAAKLDSGTLGPELKRLLLDE